MWIWTLIALVVLIAGFSIYGGLDTRRDLRSGSPSYASVVDFTGIGSPAEVKQLLGLPDESNRFRLSPADAAKLPRRTWVLMLDTIVGDCAVGGMAVAGGVVVQHNTFLGWGLVLAAAAYQAVGYLIAMRIFIQHPPLRE